MLRKLLFVAAIAVNAALLVAPRAMAQRRGGESSSSPVGGLETYSRPDGVDEKDQLKEFHDAMALQATSQQAADFQSALKITEAAKAELQTLLQNAGKSGAAATAPVLDQAITSVRTANGKFQDGFSPEQRAGLREVLRRFAKTDSDLEQEQEKLDQSLAAKSSAEISASTDRLDKVLSDFYDQQLAIGRKMSIMLSTGQDVAFMLTPVKTPVHIASQTISVPTSGRLLQVSNDGGRRTFRLELMSSLLDLQQNVSEVARAEFNRGDRCGERIEIRNASLTPALPAGLLSLQLHYERWMCARGMGQSLATELAEGDGTVEIKLTAGIDKTGTLQVAADLGRTDAGGMMADSLKNGSLGDVLRDKSAQMILSAAQAETNFKAVLPPALQNSATIQSARFEDAGVGALGVILNGQVQLSDEQANALAGQLNQALSAQGTAAQ
jgi:hypothetical protein